MLLSSSGQLLHSTTTLADRSPSFANANYYNTSSLSLVGSWASYAHLYKTQLWIGVVVRKLAAATARLPFGIQMDDGNGGRTPEQGPLDDLLRRPNPQLSGLEMWRWVSSIYDIYGESFLIKIRDRNGRVRELWPMHPANVIVRRSDEDGRIKYQYAAGGAVIPGIPEWDQVDVVAFKAFNPDTMTRGLSNLEGLRMTLLNEDASRRATHAFWQNGARPGVILEHPKTLGDDALAHLQQQFDAGGTGPENFGKTKVLEEGMKANIVQLNLEEMQYIDSRRLHREEVCSSYDVPPPVVHILDRATFSNITEQLRSMYRDTMAPRNGFFEAIIDEQLVTDFYALDEAKSRFDMGDVLRGDFEKQAEAIGGLIEKGVYKPSEARPIFGLTPAGPEADQLYGNAALVPLGSNSRGQVQISTEGKPMPQALAAPRPQLSIRALNGRIGQAKAAGKAALREQMVDEHAKELRAVFAEQRAAAIAAAKKGQLLDPADWNDSLAKILSTLSTVTTAAIGGVVAKSLGGKYDPAPIAEWLDEDAVESAGNLNGTTAEQLKRRKALVDESDDLDLEDEIGDYFDTQLDARADEIALSRVVMLAGFASLVAAGQSGASTKKWIVTSSNPRPSHAAVDGEAVELNALFSNGMNGPGDFTGGADEVAGCTCELEFTFEE